MKLRDRIIVFIIYLSMCCGAGVFGGYAISSLLPKDSYSVGRYLLALADVLIVFYLLIAVHICIHETGHLIFGLITGYQFSSIRFFSVILVKLDGKVRVKKYSVANTGGQCLMTPPRIDGTSPVSLYHWGGCIANIFTAGLAAILACAFASVVVVKMVFLTFTIVGVGTAVLNGLPLKALSNDGYNAVTLRKRPHARRAFEKSMLLIKNTADGRRLKDMPAEWFDYEIGKYPLDDNILTTMAVTTLNYHVDCLNFEKACELGKHLLQDVTLIAVHQMIVVSETVYCMLMTDRDKADVDAILTEANQKLMKLYKAQPSVYRVWYTYELLYHGDEENAREHKQMFEKIAEKYPYQADLESERELMKLAWNKAKGTE